MAAARPPALRTPRPGVGGCLRLHGLMLMWVAVVRYAAATVGRGRSLELELLLLLLLLLVWGRASVGTLCWRLGAARIVALLLLVLRVLVRLLSARHRCPSRTGIRRSLLCLLLRLRVCTCRCGSQTARCEMHLAHTARTATAATSRAAVLTPRRTGGLTIATAAAALCTFIVTVAIQWPGGCTQLGLSRPSSWPIHDAPVPAAVCVGLSGEVPSQCGPYIAVFTGQRWTVFNVEHVAAGRLCRCSMPSQPLPPLGVRVACTGRDGPFEPDKARRGKHC
jgi:hypothetical protein